MEPQSLFRKCLLMTTLEILQKPDIKQKMYECVKDSKEQFYKDVRKIQTIATGGLKGYNFASSIESELRQTFAPLCRQIMSQITSYKDLGCFHDKIFDDFVWNSNGTINNLETCKKIFERDIIDYDMKVRLACVYCLEDKVEDLLLTKDGYWKIQMNDILFSDWSNCDNTLIKYWFQRLKKKISKKEIKITVTDENVIKRSILLGNKVATQYFFLSMPEKKDVILNDYLLSRFGPCTYRSCQGAMKVQWNQTLFYLIKQYKTEDLREQCLKNRAHLTESIPACFLTFPYKNYFFLYGKVVLPFIEKEEAFFNLLAETSKYFHLDPKLYEKIYSEIWKEYCLKYEYTNILLFNDQKSKTLIRDLLREGKYDFIVSIIKHLRDSDKRIFFDKYAEVFMDKLIYKGEKDDIFKRIAASCLLNKNEVIELRDDWNNSPFKNKDELSDSNKSKDEDYDQKIKCRMLDIINCLLESFDSRSDKTE